MLEREGVCVEVLSVLYCIYILLTPQNEVAYQFNRQLVSMRCCIIEGRKFSILPNKEKGYYIYSKPSLDAAVCVCACVCVRVCVCRSFLLWRVLLFPMPIPGGQRSVLVT